MTTLGLRFYALATAMISPAAGAVLRRRARAGKEDVQRLGERLGRAGAARPDGALVWLHAVSVGESLSLLPLVARLGAERPDLAVLVTSGTRTSAQLLAGRLPQGVIHQYAPVDTPHAVRRFLDHWRPSVGLFLESELWPNLILGARRRGVRLALLSARITEDSAKGWRRARGAARALLGAFELVLSQDEETAARIRDLGGNVDGRLNLKDVADPLPVDQAELARMRQVIGDRPVILAASTHPGEEELVASAVWMMAKRGRRPLLIIAPRHPDRGPRIADDVGSDQRVVARRGAGEAAEARTDVYVADTLGEMGLFYRLADVAVMGGSLGPAVGGHNPLEPARLGVGCVVGQSRYNFEAMYNAMLEAGCAVEVQSEDELTAALDDLLANPERRAALGAAARTFARDRAAEFEAAWTKIASMAPPP